MVSGLIEKQTFKEKGTMSSPGLGVVPKLMHGGLSDCCHLNYVILKGSAARDVIGRKFISILI